MDNELMAVGGSAVICSMIMQWLKASSWFPFLSSAKEFAQANRVVSILVAGIASLGITYSYDDSQGVLVISGLTLASLGNGLMHWFGQWVSQQVAYKKIICDTEILGDIRNLLQAYPINQPPKKD